MESELIKEIENIKKRIDKLESIFQGDSPSSLKKRASVREFLLTTKAEDKVQTTLLIGYFLEKNESMGSFTVKELERSFIQAKESVPTNTNDMINKNISKGFIMETEEKKDGKKAWCLTNTGEKFVETNLLK
jgi:hypothetical protein